MPPLMLSEHATLAETQAPSSRGRPTRGRFAISFAARCDAVPPFRRGANTVPAGRRDHDGTTMHESVPEPWAAMNQLLQVTSIPASRLAPRPQVARLTGKEHRAGDGGIAPKRTLPVERCVLPGVDPQQLGDCFADRPHDAGGPRRDSWAHRPRKRDVGDSQRVRDAEPFADPNWHEEQRDGAETGLHLKHARHHRSIAVSTSQTDGSAYPPTAHRRPVDRHGGRGLKDYEIRCCRQRLQHCPAMMVMFKQPPSLRRSGRWWNEVTDDEINDDEGRGGGRKRHAEIYRRRQAGQSPSSRELTLSDEPRERTSLMLARTAAIVDACEAAYAGS